MKKSNILIVVFAVIITAASMAGAQMADVNFNQRVPQVERSKAFTGIGTVENDLPAIPLPTAASNTETTVFRKLDGAGLQRLRKEMFNIPGLPKEFSQAINSKNVAIFYNNYGVSLVNQVRANSYSLLWERNKYLLEFLINQEAAVIQAGVYDKKVNRPSTKEVGDDVHPLKPGGFGGPSSSGGGGTGGGGTPCGVTTGPEAQPCDAPN